MNMREARILAAKKRVRALSAKYEELTRSGFATPEAVAVHKQLGKAVYEYGLILKGLRV